MFKLLLAPQWKKYAEKLTAIGFDTSNLRNTTFKDISMLIIIDVINGNKLQYYLKAMRKKELDPAVMLKFCVFIHVVLQEKSHLDQNKVINFLGYLLQKSSVLISEYASLQGKDQTVLCTKSACIRSISTRQDEVICKQVLLLSALVRPYIGYLMKIISNSATYHQWRKKKANFEKHEAWMMINLLKSITSFTNQFTMIGRYYMRSYGYLVVILTKTLSRDIRMYIQATGRYVSAKNCILSCSFSMNEEHKMEIEEFIKMLEEITKLNDQLLAVYLGKYFFEQLQDIPEPKWINTNSSQFDTIFKLRKVLSENASNLQYKVVRSIQNVDKEIKIKEL